jgi:Flp pilus assembly protein TadD
VTTGRRFHAGVVALLAALTAALYASTLDDEWHFDDRNEITPSVRALRPHIDPSHYRGIVTRWSWAIDYRLHGPHPRGYHVTSLVIHFGNASLLYWITWMLASRTRARRVAAMSAAGVFCAHPLATQSVAYLTQRSTSLATLFFLLALGGWIAFRSSAGARRWAWHATSLAALALGLYTKHIALMLPAAIVLFEALFPAPRRRLAAIALVPMLVLVAWRCAEYSPRLVPPAPPAAPAPAIFEHHSRAQYALAQPRSIATYLRLFVFPKGQNLDWDLKPPRSLADPGFFGPALLLAALGAAAWALRRRRPLLSFGVGWFFVALVPTSSFVPIGGLLFEHRAYLPMAGLCLALGDVVGLVHDRRPRAAQAVVAGLLLALGAATVRRNAAWDTELSLWTDVVRKSPEKARGHVNLGLAWQNAGRLADAEREYRRALEIHPGHALALNNLGNVLRRTGRVEEAERALRGAIAARPKFANPRTNLGNLAMDRGDLVAAEALYREALRLAPGSVEARYDLAKALEGQGRRAEAIEEYARLCADYPEDPLFASDLGCALLLDGDASAAERALRRAVEGRPDWEVAWYNLALALEAQGRRDEAIGALEKAVALRPSLDAARARLAALRGS